MPFGGIFGRRRRHPEQDPHGDRRRRRDPYSRRGPGPGEERPSQGGRSLLGGGVKIKLLIALAVAAFALFQYFTNTSENPYTGEDQRVGGITVAQEIALGIQAAPQMEERHKGIHPDPHDRARVSEIGWRLVRASNVEKSGYEFKFTLLADPRVVNAFALPGGQIFMTYALYGRLRTEGEIAGVLGHEIGHVVERHGAERMAKAKLTQGLTGAAVLASWDPSNPTSAQKGQIAAMVLNLMNMKYGRDDELESDDWGVKFMAEAGYDPNSLIGVMDVLEQASGGKRQAEFMSTHPSPDRRRERIREAIKKHYPEGLPPNLVK